MACYNVGVFVTTLKTIIYNNVICFCLQMLTIYKKTKHNLIFTRKLVENCFRRYVFVMYLF